MIDLVIGYLGAGVFFGLLRGAAYLYASMYKDGSKPPFRVGQLEIYTIVCLVTWALIGIGATVGRVFYLIWK